MGVGLGVCWGAAFGAGFGFGSGCHAGLKGSGFGIFGCGFGTDLGVCFFGFDFLAAYCLRPPSTHLRLFPPLAHPRAVVLVAEAYLQRDSILTCGRWPILEPRAYPILAPRGTYTLGHQLSEVISLVDTQLSLRSILRRLDGRISS